MPKFFLSRCETCTRDLFANDDFVAYRLNVLKGFDIEFIDLNGRQPWSGIRCVCQNCIDKLNHFYLEEVPKTEWYWQRKVQQYVEWWEQLDKFDGNDDERESLENAMDFLWHYLPEEDQLKARALIAEKQKKP